MQIGGMKMLFTPTHVHPLCINTCQKEKHSMSIDRFGTSKQRYSQLHKWCSYSLLQHTRIRCTCLDVIVTVVLACHTPMINSCVIIKCAHYMFVMYPLSCAHRIAVIYPWRIHGVPYMWLAVHDFLPIFSITSIWINQHVWICQIVILTNTPFLCIIHHRVCLYIHCIITTIIY
jgi:hypothetical protein